jgi:hypothetical protein
MLTDIVLYRRIWSLVQLPQSLLVGFFPYYLWKSDHVVHWYLLQRPADSDPVNFVIAAFIIPTIPFILLPLQAVLMILEFATKMTGRDAMKALSNRHGGGLSACSW